MWLAPQEIGDDSLGQNNKTIVLCFIIPSSVFFYLLFIIH